ncbi:MAG: hypothetical protein L0Z46_09020 [Nitrospiraceae bacterium]|nr:hypothetical protein [Nitrospiraceae bacterium]
MSNPDRRYVAVRTVGNIPVLLQHIRHAVRTCRLTGTIPVVKFEKKVQRGEFYVFLAVEGVEGNLPQDVKKVLGLANLRPPYHWPCPAEQIQSMVMRSDIETHGLNSLTYRPFMPPDVGDPFDSSIAARHARANPNASNGFAQLLGWLSLAGSGTWDIFVRACQTLDLDQIIAPHVALRHLQLLGHIEVASDGRRWAVAPPAIVQSSGDHKSLFIAGQRTMKKVAAFRAARVLTERGQPNFDGPPHIELAGEALDWSEFSSAGDIASRLAEILPDLEQWKNTLPAIDRLNTSNFDLEYWTGDRFKPCIFVEGKQSHNVAGMYRLTARSGFANRFVTFYDRREQKWLQADWYALRFLALSAENAPEPAVYSQATFSLLIPAQQRWPILYEKVLVLASGLLPSPAANPGWLQYHGIPLSLCRAVGAKLGVPIKE